MAGFILWILVLNVFPSCLKALANGPKFPIQKCDDTTPQKDFNSFLWLIKRSPPAYFYGTIHVPYTRVWDFIPLNSKEAFASSQHVYFELDLTDEKTMKALMKCQMLPAGSRLKSSVPRKMYKRLKSHLRYIKRMIPLWLRHRESPYVSNTGLYANKLYEMLTKDWEKKRPIWVMLMVNSLTESDIKTRGIPVLDQYLALEAARNQKIIGAVENVDEQCKPLNALNTSQVIFALNQSLRFQEKLRRGQVQVTYTTDDLIDHYNCGDLKSVLFSTQSTTLPTLTVNSSLEEREQKRAQEIDLYFRNELIFQRNKRMAQRVIELLRDYPERDFFFAFGAGHFLGNHSIIDIMRKHGYDLEYIQPEQKLPSFKAKKSLYVRREKRKGCLGKRKRKRKRCEAKRKRKGPDYSRVRLLHKVNRGTKPTKSRRVTHGNESDEAPRESTWFRSSAMRPGLWTLTFSVTCLVAWDSIYSIIR